MPRSSIHRRLAFAALLLLGSLASGRAVTLLPQEQAIADDMVGNSDQGRPYMVLDPVIEAVARARAQDMATRNYFSEVNPDGIAADYLLTQAGYRLPSWWSTAPATNYVESIAAGSPDPGTIWTAWMNSPPHKEHLLAQNSFYATETHYGVGYAYNPNSAYQYYWVVITAPPQPIEITNPGPAAKVTTPGATIAGTTDPGSKPASVQYRVENAGGDGPYQTAAGTTNWSGSTTLAPGPNVIRAQSLDGSGNVIAQTTCAVTYIVEGTLTVTVSGSGSVTAALAGVTTQPVGEPVTLKATPAAGYIFTGWTGSIVSGSASLRFAMQDGLSLEANFQPSPFLALAGAWYGALTGGSNAQTGLVRLTVSRSGLFTGRINLAGKAWSFAGTLDAGGAATVVIAGTDPVTIALQANLEGGQISGTVTVGAASFDFAVSQSTFNAVTNIAPQAGRYTVALAPGAGGGSTVPQGDGYAALVVSPNGGVTLAGRLADGTPYSATGHVANDGTLALYCVPSGAPAGSSLAGLLTFRSTDVTDLDGALAWTKTPRAGDRFYPAGFSTQLSAAGSLYVRPAPGLQYMDAAPGAATAALGGGNIAQPIEVPVLISLENKAVMATPGPPDVTLAINPLSGVVSGSFLLPAGSLPRALRGVVLQKQKSAAGYFRGVDQCGGFSLTQTPPG